MSHPQQPEPSRLTDRVTELEIRYTHLQQTIEGLSEVVLEHQNRLDTLLARVDRLVERTAEERASHRDGQPRGKEDVPAADGYTGPAANCGIPRA
jgi:uncharacterized coiled-coil protein SlyX